MFGEVYSAAAVSRMNTTEIRETNQKAVGRVQKVDMVSWTRVIVVEPEKNGCS